MEAAAAAGVAAVVVAAGGGLVQSSLQDADAGCVCTAISISVTAAVSAADTIKLVANFDIISARTTCRWDRCRHREAWHPQNS